MVFLPSEEGNAGGNKKLKIGELALVTGLTKRTVDHYTHVGLLEAERSDSNYRYYPEEMIERIRQIEKLKHEGLTLEHIKRELNITPRSIEFEEVDIQNLRLKMTYLEKDVTKLIQLLDSGENDLNKQLIKKKIKSESVALMKSLLLLIP